MLTLAEVLDATGGSLQGARVDERLLRQRFSRLVIDSRQAAPGALFVAIKGAKHDGHAFVAQALAQGAAGALVERVPADCVWAFEPRADGPPLIVVPSTEQALLRMARFALDREPRLDVVGITGSRGKT